MLVSDDKLIQLEDAYQDTFSSKLLDDLYVYATRKGQPRPDLENKFAEFGLGEVTGDLPEKRNFVWTTSGPGLVCKNFVLMNTPGVPAHYFLWQAANNNIRLGANGVISF